MTNLNLKMAADNLCEPHPGDSRTAMERASAFLKTINLETAREISMLVKNSCWHTAQEFYKLVSGV